MSAAYTCVKVRLLLIHVSKYVCCLYMCQSTSAAYTCVKVRLMPEKCDGSRRTASPGGAGVGFAVSTCVKLFLTLRKCSVLKCHSRRTASPGGEALGLLFLHVSNYF